MVRQDVLSWPRTLALGLLLAACQRTPVPVDVGVGLRANNSALERQIGVEGAVVPWLDVCANDSLITKAAGAFACVDADRALVSPAPRADLVELSVRVDRLAARGVPPDPCAPLPDDLAPPDYEFDSVACTLTVLSGHESFWWVLGTPLKPRPGQVGSLRLTCPLLPICNGSDRVWSQLSIHVLDPDGSALGRDIAATVYHGGRAICADRAGNCTLHSSSTPEIVEKTLRLDLGRHRPNFSNMPGQLPLGSNAYWLEIILTDNVAGGGELQFHAARID